MVAAQETNDVKMTRRIGMMSPEPHKPISLWIPRRLMRTSQIVFEVLGGSA